MNLRLVRGQISYSSDFPPELDSPCLGSGFQERSDSDRLAHKKRKRRRLQSRPIMTSNCPSASDRSLPQIYPPPRLRDTEWWWVFPVIDVAEHLEILVVIPQWRRRPEDLGWIEKTGGGPCSGSTKLTPTSSLAMIAVPCPGPVVDAPGTGPVPPAARNHCNQPAARIYRGRQASNASLLAENRWRDATVSSPGSSRERMLPPPWEASCPVLDTQLLRCARSVIRSVRSEALLPAVYRYLAETVALVTPPRVDWTMTEVTCRLGPGLSFNCQLLVASTTAVPIFSTGAPGVVL